MTGLGHVVLISPAIRSPNDETRTTRPDTFTDLIMEAVESADWRNKKVASTTFAEVIKKNHLHTMFPGVKSVKLIARRINDAAMHLYTGAGFVKGETIDPKVYGESYSDCYLGYRLAVAQ